MAKIMIDADEVIKMIGGIASDIMENDAESIGEEIAEEQFNILQYVISKVQDMKDEAKTDETSDN